MDPSVVSDGLIVAGFVAVAVACVLLLVLCRRETRARRTAHDRSRTDVANMVILLQTMRDMLDQQKTLAREFNQAVDHKVGAVRKVVRAVRDEQKRLDKTYRELRQMMAVAKSDLAEAERVLDEAWFRDTQE